VNGLVERWATALEVLVVSARMQISQSLSATTTVVFAFIQPAVLLLVTLLPLQDPTPRQVSNVMIGVLLTAFWTATVWGSASVLRHDRAMGTLAHSLSGVMDARLVVVGKGLGSSALSIVLVSMTVGTVLLVLRKLVMLERPVWLVLGLLAVLVSGAAVGLLVGSIFVLTRYGPQLSSALMYPVFLLGGMLIPPDALPSGLRWVSYGISLRWLQQFLAGAATGEVELRPLAFAIALTALYGLLGVLLFQRIVTRSRRESTLELF
jgi:ABC-2 type transport system permease protein